MLGDDFYANQLTASARGIYDYFLATFNSKQISSEYCYKTHPPNFPQSLNDGVNAVNALSRDHPEFFFLSSRYTVTKRGFSLVFRGLTVYSSDQIARIEKLLDRELHALTNDLKRYGDWDRERIIYERIASRYQYRNHNEHLDYNVVGLLLREEGVCSAYVNMFILALRKAGIACHRVSGGGHAWTMVYINDIPLHCDVTWESHQGNNSISYSYFNVTTDEISRDHVLEGNTLPQCRFKGYGYHKKNGCYFSSPKAAARYIRASILRGDEVIRLKADSFEMTNEIVKSGIRKVPFGKFQFSVNEKQCTAIIQRIPGGGIGHA